MKKKALNILRYVLAAILFLIASFIILFPSNFAFAAPFSIVPVKFSSSFNAALETCNLTIKTLAKN